MKKIMSAAVCAVIMLTMVFGAYAKFHAFGDVTGDNKINSSDALSVLMTSVGLRTLDADETLAADVDGNGKINSSDALFILNFSVGKVKEFPAESAGSDPGLGHDVY